MTINKFRMAAIAVSLSIMAIAVISCSDEDEEQIDADLEQTVVGKSYMATEFTLGYGTHNGIYYETCSVEAEPFYKDPKYSEALTLSSISIIFNADKTAIVQLQCPSEAPKTYTWSAVKKAGALYIKLSGNGENFSFEVASHGYRDLYLRITGYDLESTFVVRFNGV